MLVGNIDPVDWAWISAFFWGLAVILHICFYIFYFRLKTPREGEYSSKKEKLIEKEMEKMKKKLAEK